MLLEDLQVMKRLCIVIYRCHGVDLTWMNDNHNAVRVNLQEYSGGR